MISLSPHQKDTQEDVLHQDVSVHQPSASGDLSGGSTSLDVDVDSVETELNTYTRVHHWVLLSDTVLCVLLTTL